MGINEKEKCIFIFIESDLRWKFFKRFHKSLIKLGYKVIYITSCLTVWIRGKLLGYHVIISNFKKYKPRIDYKCIKKEILDVESGSISFNEAAMLMTKWNILFDKIASDYSPQICFIYNGTSVFTYAAKIWSKKCRVKSLFFELANIDGKMFVDSWGTNAKSKLYHDIKILDRCNASEQEFYEWLCKYKTNVKIVKQAMVSKNIINVIMYGVNQLWFSCYLNNRSSFIGKEVRRFYHRYKPRKKLFSDGKNIDNIKDINKLKPYYLFPMQVSIDSQILLNSDVSLKDAIRYVKERAQKDGVKLVIKKHPAERDGRMDIELRKIRNENILVVDDEYNLADLVTGAEKLFTINSTMGLEAVLYGVKVEFLGKSIYKYLSDCRNGWLYKYIINYLIDLDYFIKDDIDVKTTMTCLERAGMIGE